MKKFSGILILFALIAVLLPSQIFACACCAERGDYYLRESVPEEYLLSEIQRIGLASAVLHTDAGYPESVVGINPLGESFSVKGALTGKKFRFEFTDDKSRSAILILSRPEKIEEFGVDQEPLSESGAVILYKEMRFKSKVQSATGFLKNGIDSETTYNLILQGRGNHCTNAEDFSSYILQVTGKKARYSFFGKLNASQDVVLQMAGEDHGVKAVVHNRTHDN
ncbi:MAG: hypothetical protein OEQ28_13105 [Acidobacteriota bacterium]|nr:hypothetical protein [Acidobacteriota bacterium]